MPQGSKIRKTHKHLQNEPFSVVGVRFPSHKICFGTMVAKEYLQMQRHLFSNLPSKDYRKWLADTKFSVSTKATERTRMNESRTLEVGMVTGLLGNLPNKTQLLESNRANGCSMSVEMAAP